MLIFVTKKLDSEELAGKLKTKDFEGIYTAFFGDVRDARMQGGGGLRDQGI